MTEEKYIENLRRYPKTHKIKVCVFILMILLSSGMLIFINHFQNKINLHISEENIGEMLCEGQLEEQLPSVFQYMHFVEMVTTKIMISAHFFALILGVWITFLIIELFVIKPRNRFILSMWDRINELEERLKKD